MTAQSKALAAIALSLTVLLACFLRLGSFLEGQIQPEQNWLPQGSFLSESDALPPEWTGDLDRAKIRFERSKGHVPLAYLHLEDGGRPIFVRTSLPLYPGWKRLGLSLWYRTGGAGAVGGQLEGIFSRGSSRLSSQVLALERPSASWRSVRVAWNKPSQANRLEVRLQLRSGALDVTALRAVPFDR
ncbi:hypothetical protein DYH09_17150 [bacterium CPR1]|nr:hypothetical protein [bacterium CPR1]